MDKKLHETDDLGPLLASCIDGLTASVTILSHAFDECVYIEDTVRIIS